MTEIELKTSFLSFDKDKSGDLDSQEWTEFCSSLDVNSDHSGQIFQLLDTENRGRVNVDDFLRAFKTVSDLQRTSPTLPLTSSTQNEFSSNIHQIMTSRSREDICEYHPDEDYTDQRSIGGCERQLSDVASEIFGSDSDVVELITKESQNHVCELYHVLNSDYPLLIEPFKAVISDFVRSIRSKQDQHDSLETVYKKERESNKIQMQDLEDELETEMQNLEEKVRLQEHEKIQTQYSSLIAQKEKALSEMRERLQQLQQLEEDAAKDPNAFLESQLKDQMITLTEENQSLRDSLSQVETRLGSINTEVYELKKQMATKTNDVVQEKSMLYNYIREQDKLTEQLHLLNHANRKLHDKNDDLRSALEVATTPTHSAGRHRGLPAGDIDDDSMLYRDYGDPDGELIPNDQTRPVEYYRLDRSPLFSDDEDENGEVHPGPLRHRPEGGFLPLRHHDRASSLASLPKHQHHPHLQDLPGTHSPHKRWSAMDFGGFFGVPTSGEESRCRTPATETNNSVMSRGPSIMLDTPERMYKVVLAGDSGVGKTSFIQRLCRQEFTHGIASTLGVDFQTKTLCIDGRLFAIQLWDTAGQERFRSISKSYFRRADGVILMYDCSFEKSFINVRSWIDTVLQETEADIPILLVGNKTDLRENRRSDGARVIDWVDGWRLSDSYRSLFIETSAKDNYNIEEAVIELARVLQNKEDFEVSKIRVGSTNINNKKQILSCCK